MGQPPARVPPLMGTCGPQGPGTPGAASPAVSAGQQLVRRTEGGEQDNLDT